MGEGWGDKVRQVKLYLRLARAQKRQKCKFFPKPLSMIIAWHTRSTSVINDIQSFIIYSVFQLMPFFCLILALN